MATELLLSSRKLAQLRVVDLKEELEKRGLEKSGVKAALTDRLKKALEEEGHHPDEYVFESPVKKGKADGEDEKADEDKDKADEICEIENGDAMEQNMDKEDKIRAEDVQDLEIEADGDVDDDEVEDMDQFDADTMTAVDEIGGSEEEGAEGEEVAMACSKQVKPEVEMETITAEEEEHLLKEVETKENAEPLVETSELECGTGEDQEDKVATGDGVDGGDNPADVGSADSSEVLLESTPTTPMSVPPATMQFTSEDTIKMDTSQERKEDDLSLIVHVDESQNDLDSDLTSKGGSEVSDSAATTAKTAVGQDKDNSVTAPERSAVASTDGAEAANAGSTIEPPALQAGEGDIAKPLATCEVEQNDNQEEGTEKDDTAVEVTSTTADKSNTSTVSKEDKPKSAVQSKPPLDEKDKKANANSRSLWISGLANSTKAGDLKTLFTKYGKVTGAKIVTNTKDPGSKCYGFVTMSQAEEASKCIQHLHRTELHGKMISVERAKSDPAAKKPETKAVQKKEGNKEGDVSKEEEKRAVDEDEKKNPEKKVDDKKDDKKDDRRERRDDRRGSYNDRRRGGGFRGRYNRGGRGRYNSRSNYWREGERRDDRRSDHHEHKDAVTDKKEGDAGKEISQSEKAAPSTAGSKEKDVLTLDKIKEAKESERLRQQERRLRQEERRRLRELERERERQRDIERRQRDEHIRLQRERERLRMEKEKLEREKLEAERERIRLERERRERERHELMEQRRIEAQRFEEQQRARKRPYDGARGSGGSRDDYWDQPKRANYGGPQNTASFERERRGGGSSYDDNRSGNTFTERRVERYDRRDGRPLDNHRDEGGRNDRVSGRNDGPRGGGRRDSAPGSGPMVGSRPAERDERGRNTDRYDRYDNRRSDQPRDDRSSNARAERGRQSPGVRRATNQQQPRAGNDRPQQRGGGNDRYQDSGSRGRGNAGGGNQSGWHSNRENRQQHNAGSSQSHSSDTRWPASNSGGQPGGRPGMTVNSAPLLQAPPASNTFLASAANIMMGVGLANRGGQQDSRYDAYSRGMQGGGQVRKY